MTVLPAAVAISVVIPEVPPKIKTPVVPCVTPPVPESADVAVIVPLFVSVVPVTVNKVETVKVPEKV